MRTLVIVVIVTALAWSAYWYAGARGAENGVSTWLDARRAEGWQAETTDITTGGFPYRFDTTLTDVKLADPDTGWAWRAPQFQILALSYKPNHIIAIWPDAQTLSTPLQSIDITTRQMRASLVVDPHESLPLARANIEVEALEMVSGDGWDAGLASAVLASERQVEPQTYRLGADIKGLRPASPLKLVLDRDNLLPDTVDSLRLDAEVAFDAPWDRYALEARRPQPTRIDLRLAQARWGKLDLKAAGVLTLDDQGTPSGDIALKAVNWREILQIAVATNLLPQALAPAAQTALETLAGLSGNPNTIDAPLTFEDGRIFLGPIPVGTAPRLVIR